MSKRKVNQKHSHKSIDEEQSLENNISIKKKKKTNKIPTKLLKTFYNTPSYDLAKNLLGKILIRRTELGICKGRIVETECYPGGEDKASCTFNGKRTAATEPLYMEPGTLFVYMTYGMYYCLNVSAAEPGGAVLIRALEPIEGINYMRQYRTGKTKSRKDITAINLCNGPSKLCTSLQITKNDNNMTNLITSNNLWIEDDPEFIVEKIIDTTRIGINSVEKQWAEKPYRFYIFGNDYVSKRDLKKERSKQ